MNYLVYKHTSPSGKSYVGITNDYVGRSRKHQQPTSGCTAFYSAILKYGWDSFTHEILIDGITLMQANELEPLLIVEHNTMYPYGYNLRTGGNVSELSDLTKQRISEANKGKILSELTKQKISGASIGKIISEDSISKRQATKLKYGDVRQPLSVEHKERISKNWSVVDPQGNEYVIRNLSQWCKDHSLNRYGMLDVANNKQNQHRGWKCSRIT